MTERETATAIDEAAAAWVARLDRGPLTPEETAELNAWLATSPRREGAFARARAVLIHADRAAALASSYDEFGRGTFSGYGQTRRAQWPTRRWALAGGAMVASIAVAAIGIELWTSEKRSSEPRLYETRRGEVATPSLADGSIVTLNTATTMTVAFSKERRDLRLIDGEALFDVAKNPDRPFYVVAGDIRVRAVGTSFAVRKVSGQPVQVMVREGVVEITREGSKPLDAPPAPVRLTANQRAVALPDGSIAATALGRDAVARALAWHDGKIAFEGTTLRDAAAEFARYGDPKIVLDDLEVGNKTISGLFAANNPAGFAQAVALSLNLNARTEGDNVHLSR